MNDWTPDLTLNHELLDAQHMDVFRKLAEVAELLEGPRAGVETAAARLADCLVAHLAAEERVMNEALYPERTRHRSAHELFMADFLQMREELRTTGATPLVADWIRRRIPEWLRFHIRVNDLPLGEFLSRRRAQHASAPSARRGDGSRRPS
jgi:hemerythrin